MIYIQNGPAWRPKVLEILNKNLVDGIIWDPREETFEKVNEYFELELIKGKNMISISCDGVNEDARIEITYN